LELRNNRESDIVIGHLKTGFLAAVLAGFLSTGLLPSSAMAQYSDYTRELVEQQKRIQQQRNEQRRILQQQLNQQRQQRYVPPANQSRQRGNTNNSNY
jgi:hypothetical protein